MFPHGLSLKNLQDWEEDCNSEPSSHKEKNEFQIPFFPSLEQRILKEVSRHTEEEGPEMTNETLYTFKSAKKNNLIGL